MHLSQCVCLFGRFFHASHIFHDKYVDSNRDLMTQAGYQYKLFVNEYQDKTFFKGKRSCPGWDLRTHFPGRALFLLSYQGSSAGRALSLQHKAKSNPNTLVLWHRKPSRMHVLFSTAMGMYKPLQRAMSGSHNYGTR